MGSRPCNDSSTPEAEVQGWTHMDPAGECAAGSSMTCTVDLICGFGKVAGREARIVSGLVDVVDRRE